MEIKDKSSIIFGNQIDNKTIKKGIKNKKKFIKKYGDDTNKEYHLSTESIPSLDFINTKNLVLSDKPMTFPKNAVVVGNIRMGFGHYRISIAIASCAKALGYEPYWFDLASFDATGSKMIREQNNLYSLASRISQKSRLFNKIIWEPLNSEGFRKITYNSTDQKNSELLAPLYNDLPKDIPFVATHVWPSQGAIHAGLTHVVNAIPDNWPMGLHLSEGAIHVVQTPFAYLGYKMLNGMAKKPLKGIPNNQLYEVGHYVDHELVANIETDVANRVKRIKNNEPVRILMSVGGIDTYPDLARYVNISGVRSTGLTGSVAIAKYVVDLMLENGLQATFKTNFNPIRHGTPRFAELSAAERAELIANDPRYGNIVCRCETVTEGQICDAIHRTLGAKSVDGVKRRLRAGMGRCQGGFCGPRVIEIIARELGISPEEVRKNEPGSEMLTGSVRE